tara:strand:+ start:5753 stop:6481 length:729 start_codon:yes stop_codon:yes gene_type:complete
MGKLNLPYKEPTRLMFKSGNPKTDKNQSVEGLKNIVVLHLNLAPADLSGYNVCPMASLGCKAACLHTAGNPVFQAQKDKGRINRARFYMQDRDKFMTQLTKELVNFVKWCDKNKKIGVVRLNTTSDISWENYNLFEKFPMLQFYDYTKIQKRALKFARGEYPPNYHLTYSLNEDNYDRAVEVLNEGGNIAVVFRKDLPDTFMGKKVVNGDLHDLRYLDPKNVVVGLKAKGKAKTDYSGFVMN